MYITLSLLEHTKNYGRGGDKQLDKLKQKIDNSHLQVFSRIRFGLSIRIRRYRIDGVEIDIIILVLNLGLTTIVGSTVCV